MNYFTGCKDKESRKKRFKQLAKKHHPDKGGDPEIFKEINRQYNEKHEQFSTGFQYHGFWTGDYTFRRFSDEYENFKKQREEVFRREQEAADKFFKDKSKPKSDHGINVIFANSKDTIKMTSIYGTHEYVYNVFSDTWNRKEDK